MMENINVWLVGAGPGDSGLLTLRGLEVLRDSQVVIYDRLVGEGILALIPDDAEKIDVGKLPGIHKVSQYNIQQIMINHAKNGLRVVRLKGGDPFLFGRGGEEAMALIEAGVNFEIVPGVSSAIAVPEYAGIPVTHRNFCSGVNIFTGHDRNNLVPDFHDNTQIFLMGIANMKDIQEKLLHTLKPDTPCAIIENGTTSRQREFRTTLHEIYNTVRENDIHSPAMLIVGKIAGLTLNWRDNLPLHDKRIIITRPSGRSEQLAKLLRDSGAEVISMPTIKTTIIHNALDGKSISGYDWVGFTSVTGVEAFFELLRDGDRDVRELGNAKIAAIGPATGEALRSRGLCVEFIPGIFDGENLAQGLSEFGGKILMLRSLNGAADIAEIFTRNAIDYTEICIYRTDYVKLDHVPEYADIIIFTSSSTVRGLCENVNNMREVHAVCIGKQTAQQAARLGFVNIRIAEQATVEEIYKAVISCT